MTKQALPNQARSNIITMTKDDEERKPLVSSVNEIKERIGKQSNQKKPNELEGTKVIPLIQRSQLLRLDVSPFVAVYLILIALDQTQDDHRHVQLMLWIAFPLALVSHLVLVLLQQWKVSMACAVGYQRANENNPSAWTHCLVECSAMNGTTDAEIVAVTQANGVAVVNFQDIIFRAPANDCDMDSLWKTTNNYSHVFHRIIYPDHFSLEFYKSHKGYTTLPQVKTAQTVYGENQTKIQLPRFLDLLGQQLLAPFFLFQLFCVVLWSMDEYWYYALFTLFALIMFECTVSYNRLAGLQRLRGTLKHPFHISCFRHGLWFMLRTDELLPGDVISLTAKANEINVPADVLILSGTAVVDEALLTGESIPQLKGPLDASDSNGKDVLNILDMQDPQHKQSILFGGTNLVSHDNEQMVSTRIPLPPDSGIVCIVLRTGYDTAQGSLLRSMAHSSMKSADGIHTKDTFVFVAMLLCCAIVSAVSVLEENWNDETRNRFKLILHVIIIVTSVVPPELPMELSLAVTNSVADLMRRCNVYCTEPYRIPWAGQVDTCCFDKTGTLTSDEMQLRGVRLFGLESTDSLVDPSEEKIPWVTLRVMAGCHALAVRSKTSKKRTLVKEVIGDPLEKAVLSGAGFILQTSNFVVNEHQESGKPRAILIHHRFAFSSRLKRMTVLITEDSDRTMWAVTKGAPETLKQYLTPESLPPDYDEVAEHHMGLGQRVLAMAYRNLGATAELKEESRDAVERSLIFCGFLILDCPLKADSKSVISELRKSGHNVVMITGDALLTAAEIARQVGIMARGGKTYELQAKKHNKTNDTGHSDVMSSFHFVPIGLRSGSLDGSIALSETNLKTLKELASRSEASFCASGAVLGHLAQVASSEDTSEFVNLTAADESNVMLHPAAQAVLRDIVPIICVFARHAPRQKEAIVAAFNLGGRHTLMCGDGTNDVGALKRAHIGISIISAPELENKHREATATIAKVKADEKRERKAKKDGNSTRRSKVSNASAFQKSMRQLQEAQEELDHVELGDASVASPFTSRAMSIRCCKDVLQQGRCTLVTMLQIYKILGVNCLVNALVLTKLHMHGVKQGDRQLTILGVAVAIMFFFITRGKPLPTLSPHRPPSSVLCRQALLSIAAQFAVHFSFIMIATDISVAFVDPYDPSIIPDARFNPNVLNTCTFLLTMLATVNTFAVNYRGRPFMEDLSENTLLFRSIQACYALLFICVMEVFPPLNDLFQLSPFPDTNMNSSANDDWISSVSQIGGLTSFVRQVGFPIAMCSFMVVDTALAFACEKIIVRLIEGPP